MKTKKIFVVACLHGTETFGMKVLDELASLKNPSIVTYVAHPRAVTKKRRFIETDLNRSFGGKTKSLESKIANDLMSKINRVRPDLIIDLHTSTVAVGKVAILAQANQRLIGVAKALGMTRAALMPRSITKNTLIGQKPSRSICVELGRGYRSIELAADLAQRIVSLLNDSNFQTSANSSILLLNVRKIIESKEVPGLKLTNYVFSGQLGGYPFLTGQKNYAEHRGFLADSVSEV